MATKESTKNISVLRKRDYSKVFKWNASLNNADSHPTKNYRPIACHKISLINCTLVYLTISYTITVLLITPLQLNKQVARKGYGGVLINFL